MSIIQKLKDRDLLKKIGIIIALLFIGSIVAGAFANMFFRF